MSKLTRGQIQDLIARLVLANPKYRAALLANPKATIEAQLNTSLGDITIKAVIDTAHTVHVVVPFVAAEGEFTDADLEVVA